MSEVKDQVKELSWVEAAGGPALNLVQGQYSGKVHGLHEEGWWVWVDSELEQNDRGASLNLHLPWVEPVTGLKVEILMHLRPSGETDVSWEAAVLIKDGEDNSNWPCRAHGYAKDFNEAYAALMSWRPVVRVVDGIALWTDPVARKGEIEIPSGKLTWQEIDDGSFHWRFKAAGLHDVLDAAGWFDAGLSGESESAAKMLEDVSLARERIRTAMRKWLLEH